MKHYIQNAAGDVENVDLMTWARWFENADRIIKQSERDGVMVSTVFLGMDHSFGGPVPVLWETMVFGGEHDGDQERYTSRQDAIAGHEAMCARVFGE